MVLVELHEGLLDETQTVSLAGHDGWRILTPCHVDSRDPQLERFDADRCPLLAEASQFEDRDFQDFLGLYTMITAKAKISRPWEQMMDKKQLHDVGDVTLQGGTTAKVWQFEKRKTAIRLLWLYAGGRRVLLATHAFAKRQQKTPISEKQRAGAIADQFFKAVNERTARLVFEQGGREGFEVLYGH